MSSSCQYFLPLKDVSPFRHVRPEAPALNRKRAVLASWPWTAHLQTLWRVARSTHRTVCPVHAEERIPIFFFHAKYGSPSHSSAPPHRRAASFVIDCHFLICLSRVSTLIFLMQSYLLFDGDLHSREGDPFKVCKKKGTLGCKTGKRHKGLETAPQKGQPQPCG